MGFSITGKIIASHLLNTDGQDDPTITVNVDQTLCHDLTGIMAGQVLETVEADHVQTAVSVIYCDHNTLATSIENSDDHHYLKTVAQRYGLHFSKPGNGICHFLHCQQFARPGQIMLGADSHTPTSGALGMLSIGSGGLSVAKAMLGEGFRMNQPKVMNVRLTGHLNAGVTAKDIALEILRVLTVKGGIGSIIEFTGDAVSSLSIPERATIANMSIEMGATTGIFPSDEVTHQYLAAQGRAGDWIELLPDSDAAYDQVIAIDLSSLEPLVAQPHMPDRVEKVRQVGSVKVNSVFIGSCTNASYSDISKAARVLRGRKVHPDVDLTIAPGSRQVLEQLIADNILNDLVLAGARILEAACGPCIGIGQVPFTNSVSVRTSNRNFFGRSGNNNASVYLASPETAAATAVMGVLTDPRDLMDVSELKSIREPDTYKLDQTLLLTPLPDAERKAVEVVRGANISPIPLRGALPDRIEAGVVLKLGDNVTTDDIIPGGSNILKHIANIPEFAEYTFCYLDPTFVQRAKVLGHSVIVGGENYGQGSSREHAAMLPMFLGVEAVIAKSFARIHKENLINYGILPLVFKNKEDYQLVEQEDRIVIESVQEQVDRFEVDVLIGPDQRIIKTSLDVSPFDKDVLKLGGALNYLKTKQKTGSVQP